jgi:hypothetical protein
MRTCAYRHHVSIMTKSRRQEPSQKFTEQWQSCRDWLLPFMQNNQPKFLTKDELRDAAMRELKVSRNAFDFAWIDAIEQAGRHDWYQPLRRRPRGKS